MAVFEAAGVEVVVATTAAVAVAAVIVLSFGLGSAPVPGPASFARALPSTASAKLETYQFVPSYWYAPSRSRPSRRVDLVANLVRCFVVRSVVA